MAIGHIYTNNLPLVLVPFATLSKTHLLKMAGRGNGLGGDGAGVCLPRAAAEDLEDRGGPRGGK